MSGLQSNGAQSGREPYWWSAREVAAAIAGRKLSAVEYLRMQLDRIERYNAALGLVVTIDERALDLARAADDAVVKGAQLGPLHGVAMTVKDCLATAGLRTTGGMTILSSYVPRKDAPVVARLRQAGAVIVGKTNVPEGAGDLQSYNDLFGVSRNPWHLDYTPGGSSGGAAGAVAAGFSPLELGSDVAGSIRIPVANCGIVGHKPSFGLVPMAGHVPPHPFHPRLLDIAAVGPIGRCVDDVERALMVIAGPDSWHEPAWRLAMPAARPVRRVAAWLDDPYCPVDAEVRLALEEAAARLAAGGVVVEEARPPGVRLEFSDRIFQRLLATLAVPRYSSDDVEQIVQGRRRSGPELGAKHVAQPYRDWVDADDQRARLRARWRQFFSRYEAVLMPVAPNLAITHDHRPFEERSIMVNGTHRPYWDQNVWAGLSGVSYLPSTVIPVRRDSRGVPIGIAIAGDYLQDLTALAVARRLAELTPSLGHPDPRAWRSPAVAAS